MKPALINGRTSHGFSVIEVVISVAILSILVSLISASYETVMARVNASRARADMDAIAQAAYTDYSYNVGAAAGTPDWDVLTLDNTEPPRIASENLLSHWPKAPCPYYYYTWDNWTPTYSVVRVGMRTSNPSGVPGRELWSYCVNTFGGGDCQTADPASSGVPIEISTTKVDHLYCTE